jgi:hypothetical protein
VHVILPLYFAPSSSSKSSEGSQYGSSNREWLGTLEREESDNPADSASNTEVEDDLSNLVKDDFVMKSKT